MPYVRFVHRLVTVVWGLAFLGEALTDTYLAYHLPIASFLVIHPFLFNGTILVAFGWATLYSMHVQKRRRAIEAHMRQTEQERATSPGKDRVTV